ATADTSTVELSSSAEAFTIGAKELGGVLSEHLTGLIDDVRVYSRALSAGEIEDLAAGEHTAAAWTGAISSAYETGGNWDTGAVPDPFTHVTIAATANQPVATADVALADLNIASGARLYLNGPDPVGGNPDVGGLSLTLN